MTDPKDKDPLEAFFAAGRMEAPEPSDALMARILADAEQVQAEITAPAPVSEPEQVGWFGTLMSAMGGWRGAGGLAACLVVGVSLGFSSPSTVTDLAGLESDEEILAELSMGADYAMLLDNLLLEGG